jgi:hypothetical protein
MATKSIQNADGTYTTYDDQSYTPPQAPSPISVTGLSNPQQPVNFLQPKETPLYPVAGLLDGLQGQESEPMQMTKTEGQAQDLTTQLQTLNEQLTGQSAYRADQEKALGVEALKKTQTDLSSRLKALQNEALAIPLQMQQDAQGRGVTAGGIAPHQTAALRNNAIQALSVNSLLEASRGNLTTALDMVDRAVAQRFEPIQEQIAAKTRNLELILSSPQYSLDQKNRAQKQLEKERQKQAQLDQAREAQTRIYDLGVKAASLGADPAVVDAIQSARSPEEALSIAAQFGVLTPADKANLQTVRLDNGETVIIDMNTGKTVRSLGGIKPTTPTPSDTPALGTLSPQDRINNTLSLAQQLRDDAAVGKKSAVGASLAKFVPFGQALGLQGNRTAFETQLSQLRASLTLDNLKLLKGAMSDKDLKFLQDIGSALDVNMTEAAFNAELDKVIERLKQSGAHASLADRARAAGYDYDRMRKDGYSDEQIEAALSR